MMGSEQKRDREIIFFWVVIILIAWSTLLDREWFEPDGSLDGFSLVRGALAFAWYSILFGVGWTVWSLYSAAKRALETSDDESHAESIAPAGQSREDSMLREGWYEPPDLMHAGSSPEPPHVTAAHVEQYWHHYAAALIAIGAVVTRSTFEGDPLSPAGVLRYLVAGYVVGWIVLGRLRFLGRSLRNVSFVSRRSPHYKLGALAGFSFYLYLRASGPEGLGLIEHAESGWVWAEALRQGDASYWLGPVIQLILFMALGGMGAEYLAKKLEFSSEEDQGPQERDRDPLG